MASTRKNILIAAVISLITLFIFLWILSLYLRERELKHLVKDFVNSNLLVFKDNEQKNTKVQVEFIDGKTIFVDSQIDNHFGSFLKDRTLHDRELIELVYAKLKSALDNKEQAVLIDVGAHTGSFALLPAINKNIYVIAFEPSITVANILQKNIEHNEIDKNVTIIPIGLSNKDEMLTLRFPKDRRSGLGTLGTNLTRFSIQNEHQQLAIVKPLDDIIKHLLPTGKKIDLIKIDTEGWEYYVLLGAINTIKEHKPILVLEYLKLNMRQTGVKSKDLSQLLADLQYNCTKLTEDMVCYPT